MIALAASEQMELVSRLVENGISVIPIGRNKRPAIPWKEFQTRLATPEELEAWFSVPGRHGIGIVCGGASGNLEVIDFDLADPEDLQDAWSCFISNVVSGCPDFPLGALSLVRTPRGLHLYYKCESPVGGSQKLARHNGTLDAESGEFRNPGYFIETRGEGGYVLSVGSPTHCHPTGGTYQAIGRIGIHEMKPITAEHREILLLEARWLGVQDAEKAPKGETSIGCASQDSAGVEFANQTSWAEILQPHGFTLVETTPDGASHWKRPGTSNPVSATTNHSGSDLFYAFSSNCGYGIEPNRGYSKFAVFTMLNHGGDFTTSAKALGQMGFGSQRDLSHIDITAVLESGVDSPADPFCFYSWSEFMSLEKPTEYLIRDVVAEQQSMVMAGPEKSLKTGLQMAMAYAISTGTPFLGQFEVPRSRRVGVMTGESGVEKLQRLLKTQFDACHMGDAEPNLFITQQLPVFSDLSHLEKLRSVIRTRQLEVLFVDPVYLCLGDYSDKTSNVAVMGRMLRDFEAVGKETGCTLILNHHTNQKHEPYKPLGLRDVTGAGFSEWMRQWFLVCPRQDFEPDTYQHRLWAVIGGSAGHAGQFAIDVREQDEFGNWSWITEVRTRGDEVRDYKAAKEARKEEAANEKADEFVQNLRSALNAGVEKGGSVIEELRNIFREHGWKGVKSIDTAKLEQFEESGFVYRQTVTRGGNPNIVTWLPSEQWLQVPPGAETDG